MNARTTRFLAAAVVTLSLATVPFVYAGPHGPRGGDRGELGPLGALLHARQALDLSDAQVDQIKTIFRNVREQNAPYREQLRNGHDAIASSLLANPNDLASAQAQIERQAAAEKTMKLNLLTAASKALNVLTPAQRTKLAELHAERQARHAARGPRPFSRQRQ